MKKIIAILLCAAALLCTLASCGGAKDDKSQYPKIATTSHVVADWTKNILDGAYDEFEMTLLFDVGKDMHNFQPSAQDIMSIATADLVIYVGGESDKWVEDAVKSTGGKVKTLKLIELVEEHTAECEDDHDHTHGADEHIWLSFENAVKCVSAISDAICEIDGDNSESYVANAEAYTAKLNGLFDEYKVAVAAAKYKTLVFADRFPFVYLMNELELEYFAAFPGCSAETTASFETVITLASKVDELGLPCVLVISNSADGISKTVVENTKSKNAAILELDSMQVWAKTEFDYIESAKNNRSVLKIALGCEE